MGANSGILKIHIIPFFVLYFLHIDNMCALLSGKHDFSTPSWILTHSFLTTFSHDIYHKYSILIKRVPMQDFIVKCNLYMYHTHLSNDVKILVSIN